MNPTPHCLLALALTLAASAGSARAQDPPAPPANRIRDLLAAHPEPFAKVLEAPKDFRVQILLGEIVEKDGVPALVQTGWRDDEQYFYPGSAVALGASVAALERCNDLARSLKRPVDERTPIAFHPQFKNELLERLDPTNVDGGRISVAHLIRRAGLTSDTQAFDRLYDFCGQKWLNERMWRAGLASTRIAHRLSTPRSLAVNRETPRLELQLGDTPWMIERQVSDLDLVLRDVGPSTEVGTGFMDKGELVPNPMSFYQKGRMPLRDLQRCLVRIARPEIALPGEPFDLTPAQRELVMQALLQYPGDSANPVYDRAKYPDDYAKFFLSGLARVVPKEHLKVYNKCGLALGFVVDNAYVVDARSGRGFFLTAAMYANSDGVLNDDRYDYDTVALPFLANAAEVIARDVWQVAK